ncbi:MAG: AMP-binding protein [Bryobacteraceae bacterium]
MDKIWVQSYRSGVPPEVDLLEHSSINDVFAQSCRKFATQPAFRNLGATLTYSDLERLSRNFAAWLAGLGLKPGTRVALMMPNLLQYPVALFGALRASMIVVNVNPLYTARELEHQLCDSEAEVIVILENFAHVLQKVLSRTLVRHVVTTEVGDLFSPHRRLLVNTVVKRIKKMVPEWRIEGTIPFRTALRRGSGKQLQEADPGPEDVALLQYTGGTTGKAKGAILTHGNLVANLLQATAWSRGILELGTEVVVTALPLYHIFSFTTNCLLFMKMGGLNLLITNPKDMPAFVREIKHSRFTVMSGVNTLYNGLLNAPGFSEVDFSRLKFALGGGAAIHRSVAERWKQVTGRALIQGYGLTEASPFVTCNPLDSEYSPTIGLPLPSTEVSIVDDQEGELPTDMEGEICVRGPQVMRGYWQLPAETEDAFTAEGWLRTGDVGVMDARGFITITDRKKDMILVSGFNVYPNEIENVVAAVPGVVECGVIGVPHDITGEAVKAFVVTEDPNLTADDVISYCRQHLTSYKVPKLIEFRRDLPKSPIGKILRRELRSLTTPRPPDNSPETATEMSAAGESRSAPEIGRL